MRKQVLKYHSHPIYQEGSSYFAVSLMMWLIASGSKVYSPEVYKGCQYEGCYASPQTSLLSWKGHTPNSQCTLITGPYFRAILVWKSQPRLSDNWIAFPGRYSKVSYTRCVQYLAQDKDIPNRKDPDGGPGTLSNENRGVRSLLHRKKAAQRSAAYNIMVGVKQQTSPAEAGEYK